MNDMNNEVVDDNNNNRVNLRHNKQTVLCIARNTPKIADDAFVLTTTWNWLGGN